MPKAAESGVKSTRATNRMEASAAWFSFLFPKNPILNKECSERILKD